MINASSSYLIEKQKELESFMDFHERRLEPVLKNRTFKLFFYNLPDELTIEQNNQYLLDRDIYKEDHGTFQILVKYLQKYFSTPYIQEADFILFPFNLQFYNKLQYNRLHEVIADLRCISGKKKIILFSIGDFCLKTLNRSTLFERQLFNGVKDRQKYIADWVRPDDIVIHFESTIDFISYDLPIFPLIQMDPVDPFENKRELLFSFVGEYYKPGWPEGFVRSPSNKDVWEQLAIHKDKNYLITTSAELATEQDGNPFYLIPRKSIFTLCPRGIACWSFRVFESILCGSIPVILSDSYQKPFSEIVPWDFFSLTFPENRLAEVDTFLQGIQEPVIKSLSENLKRNQRWFTAGRLIDLVSMKLQKKLSAV